MTDIRQRQKSFWALMVTQFFGAFNDNVLKILVTLQIVALVAVAERRDQLVDLTGAVFVAPFLIFSMISGRVADRISKSRVAVATKVWELLVIAMAVISLYEESIPGMMASLFVLSMQATFFSPAKYGILPELYGEDKLSEANGWLNLSTFLAILLGTFVGTLLGNRVGAASIVMAGASILGLLASFRIERLPAGDPTTPLAWNPITDFIANWKVIRDDQPLKLSVIAVNYFWFLGAIVQLTVFIYAKDMMDPGRWSQNWANALGAPPSQILAGLLIVALAIGVGVGSYLAGRISHGRVEIGLVPLGCFGCGVFSLLLAFGYGSNPICILGSLGLGFFAGLYEIPLMALIQWRAPADERGRILATVNWLSFAAIAAASGFLLLIHSVFDLNPAQTMIVLSAFSFIGTALIVYLVPEMSNRFILYLVTNLFYRARISGVDHIPVRGPALLVANQAAPGDAFLVASASPRPLRFFMKRHFCEAPFLQVVLRRMQVIPGGDSLTHEQTTTAWREARMTLERGELVCLLIEEVRGGTGLSDGFSSSYGAIVGGTNVPVIPVRLEGMRRSLLNEEANRVIWRWPQGAPYRVSVSIGKPIVSPVSVEQIFRAVQDLKPPAG